MDSQIAYKQGQVWSRNNAEIIRLKGLIVS